MGNYNLENKVTFRELAPSLQDLISKSRFYNLRKSSYDYIKGDIAYSENLPTWSILECVQAGTTNKTEPTWPSTVKAMDQVSDGSVTWKILDIKNLGGGGASSSKYIYTTNGSFNVAKDGYYSITAIAGGGAGSSCMGCGGGSGESLNGRIEFLEAGDSVEFTIGTGSNGSKNCGYNIALPSSGTPYAGQNGGNTTIKIIKKGVVSTIVLKGGTGATCTPSSVLYSAGLGENNGGVMSMNMLNNSTMQTTWNGGDGANSIFGSGGSGGFITYNGYASENGKNAIAYGAGGGGGGLRQVGTSGTYYWTAGGDGMQGAVIIEVI